VRLVGQLFQQCVLFSRGEIHEVVDSGNKDVPLLTLSLRSELVMTAQNIQCTVEVQPQSGQGPVYKKRGPQSDDIPDDVPALGLILPIKYQPAERLPNHLILLLRITLFSPDCHDVRERKPGCHFAPRRKFATFTPLGCP
jgi:hypothetical protein